MLAFITYNAQLHRDRIHLQFLNFQPPTFFHLVTMSRGSRPTRPATTPAQVSPPSLSMLAFITYNAHKLHRRRINPQILSFRFKRLITSNKSTPRRARPPSSTPVSTVIINLPCFFVAYDALQDINTNRSKSTPRRARPPSSTQLTTVVILQFAVLFVAYDALQDINTTRSKSTPRRIRRPSSTRLTMVVIPFLNLTCNNSTPAT